MSSPAPNAFSSATNQLDSPPTAGPVHCLLVDDDPEIRQLLLGYLAPFGYEVEAVADGAALRSAMRGDRMPELVLLDLMLPDESGLDLCQWLKLEWPGLPVIMLTAQGDTPSRVLGLELGADDYLPKPFEPRELVARMKAVLRRSGEPVAGPTAGWPPAQVRFNGWTFDRVARQLKTPDGMMMALSAAEYRLLCAMVDHPQQVLSRDRLLDLTRAPGVEVSERSVDLSVSRLRAKLGDRRHQSQGELIRTLRGAGYIFTGKVQA
ncbi:response regulator transcription factor [Hydrogenophaga sp. 5NK40-0174]|uniref:response regulator transcription factor n=1 Tax=Hydrogenophaga sp. 5NK40-0174 TaxID=3127649 RepID=UPI003108C579